MTLRRPEWISLADWRTLKYGLAALAAVVILGKGGPTWRRLDARVRASADSTVHALAAARSAVATRDMLRDSLNARGRRLDIASAKLLVADVPLLAAAELADRVTEFAISVGARIRSTALRADSAFVSGVAHAGLRISIETDVQGLAGLLARIEGDEAAIAVRKLSVTSGDVVSAPTRAEVLTVDIDVDALVLRLPIRGVTDAN